MNPVSIRIGGTLSKWIGRSLRNENIGKADLFASKVGLRFKTV